MLYQTILVATDGSELGTAAVEHAAGIARACNAQLTIVTVALQFSSFCRPRGRRDHIAIRVR